MNGMADPHLEKQCRSMLGCVAIEMDIAGSCWWESCEG